MEHVDVVGEYLEVLIVVDDGVFVLPEIVVEDRGQRVEDRGAQASVEHDIESRQVDLYEAVVVVSRT